MPSSLGRIGNLQYGETPAAYERIGGRLYVCSGHEPARVFEPGRSVWRNAGMEVAPDALIEVGVEIYGSPGLNGDYVVCATEYDADADLESNCTARTEVSPNDECIKTTINGYAIKNPTTTHVRIYRTIDGGAYPTMAKVAEIAVADIIGGSVGEYNNYDDVLDADLDFTEEGLPVLHDPPPVMMFPIYCKRRLFTWGDVTFGRGTARVENDSRTVLANGSCGWNRGIEYQRIIFGTQQDEYEVQTFGDGSPQDLALSEFLPPYAGPTDTDIAYRTYRATGRLRWSTEEAHEYFPPGNERYVAKGRPMVPTGGGAFAGRLVLFFPTETHLLQFDDDPAEGRGIVQQLSGSIGCIAHRTTRSITIGGQERIVWLSRKGIASSSGGGIDVVSSQPNYPGGMDGFFKDMLVNPAGYNQVACAANLSTKGLYVCAVPTVNGNGGCDKVVVWDYVLNNFWVWEFPFEIYSMESGWEYLVGGQKHEILVMGTDDGLIAKWPVGNTDMAERNRGDSDSPAAGDLAGTVTSSGASWLEDTAKTFITKEASPPEKLGLEGSVVSVEHANGTIEVHRIKYNTDHRITITDTWTTTPAAGVSYWVGEIEAYYQTPQIDLGSLTSLKHIKFMHAFYEVEEQGTLYFDFYEGRGAAATSMADGTSLDLTGATHPIYSSVPESGMHKIPLNPRSYRWGWKTRNRKPNEPWALNRIAFDVAAAKE